MTGHIGETVDRADLWGSLTDHLEVCAAMGTTPAAAAIALDADRSDVARTLEQMVEHGWAEPDDYGILPWFRRAWSS